MKNIVSNNNSWCMSYPCLHPPAEADRKQVQEAVPSSSWGLLNEAALLLEHLAVHDENLEVQRNTKAIKVLCTSGLANCN
ncbi:hypothetical protein TSAR_016364 [Trichomalopsis sarcophagae]|uniref:Uncharacterized protein n=1 Tax=Trichomalopsis sarcophagae TaxID=543379 RepID=A0A232EL85_9HYME|nr:hypothetical protein TSAR_016364 [Trichomalopsis sarcophagae]